MLESAQVKIIANGVVGDDYDREILWSILPLLGKERMAEKRVPQLLENPRDLVLRSTRMGLQLIRVNDTVFVMRSVNQRRSLEPIFRELARQEAGIPENVVGMNVRPRSVGSAWKRCSRLELGISQRFSAEGEQIDRQLLRRRLLKAIRAREIVEHSLAKYPSVKSIVVSNQHLADHRSILRWAHLRGLHSIYVPHAPVANNDRYRDLPIVTAALRGPAEVDFYRRLGVPDRHLHVVGNPGVPVLEPPRQTQGPIVLSLSPWSPITVSRVVDLVRSGVSATDEVVVAPHPRSNTRQIRKVIPSSWSIYRGRTLDLLATGPRLLVQRSSGIAWEAMYLGIPTVQVTVDDCLPSYPLIAPPYIPTLSSPEQVRQAIAHPPMSLERESLRSWARQWVASVGRDAVFGVLNLLNDSQAQPSSLALDSWALGDESW